MNEKNPDSDSYKRMSVEELRSFKGCEDYTYEEATEIIYTLEQMTIVLFKLYQKNKKLEEFDAKIEPIK